MLVCMRAGLGCRCLGLSELVLGRCGSAGVGVKVMILVGVGPLWDVISLGLCYTIS